MIPGDSGSENHGDLFADVGKAARAWIDGASSGNPGPAGAGVVIKKGGKTVGEWMEYLGRTTNNVAEYKSLILALRKALKLGIEVIIVYTDSELLHRQLNGIYKVKTPHIRELFDKVQALKKRFILVRINHIRREENKQADRLAKKARSSPAR
ncbi:reverse transcriptase-like protein [candidate division WOR-3 bacterium]|uniref:Reverse transcriptase-like protein n=1 Tax=candidate division WOR-3 bacterium TaxID=2052148 RepID=A0A9D5K7S6_UNCW3|nr:reverse transcriptase-like protein [candidate division WOR-3 bacterium]MBD3363650.1 reverse transcriptase-like protein [candidate division WOR-3 bacterium]